MLVEVGARATFDVVYSPTQPTKSQAAIQLSIEDNQYEDSVVQLIGEGYEDDITLDNIHSVVKDSAILLEDESMTEEDVEGMS